MHAALDVICLQGLLKSLDAGGGLGFAGACVFFSFLLILDP